MKTIIVPLDFSEQSENALQVAASLARKHDSEILVLHMLELNQAIISSTEGYYQEHTVFLLKLAEKRLSEFLDKPFLKGVKITPVIKHFKVFSEVNEVAEKHNASLVVMGSHGSDGLEELFIGSNAEKVVRHSTVPVLVIKKKIEDFQPKTMIFASDFEMESVPAFKRAKDFAKLLNMDVKPLFVNTPGDDFLSSREIYQKISEFQSEAVSGESVEIYQDYSVEQGVLNFAEDYNADIIGISTHGRKGLSHFFMGSIGEDIANHSNIPVVTFKIPSK
ncbi:universal stress protein [Zeaxanthinibacter sp. PT1]|uniref:universal stress protein n=1 Tax=Zeaxanthinibacter TaxID=561554 RepID=UPI0023496BE9|nr:universal stress protein [Zeaxanthinibacter sp. PT1]MDC6350266.1 universal stress protein [Zeaxanthinibacter sp. PT1]